MSGSTPSRRTLLRGAAAFGALLVAPALPVFTPRAEASTASASPVPPGDALSLWYTQPGVESSMMATALPVGNGRLGALLTGDTAEEAYCVTDASCWAGGANASLGSDGQFPYDTDDFGTQQLLAKAYLRIPGHTGSAITGYQRQLDLSNGLVSATYQFEGIGYRRDVYASHPDDVIVIHLTQGGGGTYTGSLALTGTRSETTTTDAASVTASFSAGLPNGLRYAAVVQARGTGGTVGVSAGAVTFTGCTEVLLVISGGTDYRATAPGFTDPAIVPSTVAGAQAARAVGLGADALLGAHLADYQGLQQAMSVNLGVSTAAQRALPTDQRLAAAQLPGAAPDPELHAAYVQFGRYLMICGSRTGLPINLQGPWQDSNSPDWMSDYHTDINLQMNYWLPDRAGLPSCFEAFADYCVNQQPQWEQHTQALFNSPDNGFRNSSGKIAGWTVAISTNVFGGLGWWWHPAGNAWLCNELFDHYLYNQDAGYLAKIYPLLKGACQFWEARLITTSYTDAAGVTHTVLVDDADWSPEHGPTDALGITYAQELVWQLFANYLAAAALLSEDGDYARTVQGLQSRLYLPQVSDTTGWLEEWMTPDNLDTSDLQHRHLSPLIGLFPGDRITADGSAAALLAGATKLLTARGMTSYGWGVAWRSACWARLKNAPNAYQCFVNGLTPSVNGSTGTAGNLLDIYGGDTFQIDANLGLPSAAVEMLVYSRPGLLQLLPALPAAWSASGSVTGVGVRGGFTVDLTWSAGQVTSFTLHNVGPAGASTVVRSGPWSRSVTVAAGRSATFDSFVLVNRNSGKAVDDPAASSSAGTELIQYTRDGGRNQCWQFQPTGSGAHTLVNAASALAMDVNGGGTAPGTPVIQWTPTGATNQQWTLADAGGGYVNLVNVRSGLVLGVSAARSRTWPPSNSRRVPARAASSGS
ncbi:glycosyl hydrolase family 95 catalytic domain-containing protein [Kitasatospora sp. NBC_01266]|uniref:glycosyl hydrolase family 95 catalytic domain-containing protein n=1 Tax=Kitasatospora sp. NBC_01266 TaxID=2903572 RepID=UPI002E319910|nr:RICIN domain-containing protein [Kitasatospora sp. NBC_01266]